MKRDEASLMKEYKNKPNKVISKVISMKGYEDGYKKVLVEYVERATVTAISILREAYKSSEEMIPIEQVPFETEGLTGSFIRALTGVEGRVKTYSEIGFFALDEDNDIISRKKAEEICDLLEKTVFKYHYYYEQLFSRTIFIACRRVRRAEKSLVIKRKNTLYVFVQSRDVDFALAVTLCYLSNLFGHRLFRFMNTLMQGRVGRFYGVWRFFRRALKGRIDSIMTGLRSSIRYIIELFENLQDRVSYGVRYTFNLLNNIFTNSLKALDEILKPLILKVRAKETLKFVRKELNTSYAVVRNVLARAITLLSEEDAKFARRYVELLSRSSVKSPPI